MSVEPVEWKNYPSTETPLDAGTLNQQQAYVRSQAEAAAQSAAAAAQSASEAGALTDQAVANVLSEPASETRAVTDALYARAGSIPEGGVDPNDVGFDIIVLLGQSNMVGGSAALPSDPPVTDDPRVFAFSPTGLHANQVAHATDPLRHWVLPPAGGVGPGVAFARRYLATVNPNRRALLVPCAQGGTAFTAGVKRWKVDHTPAEENLYLLAIRQVELAIDAAGPNSRIVGFLWHQGEGDTGHSGYADDLDAVIIGLREHFDVPGAWFLVGQMSPAGTALSPGRQAIDAVHIDTPRRNYRTAFAPVPYGLHRPGDTTHFSAQGHAALAASYAAAIPLAQANVTGFEPTPPSNLRAGHGPVGALTLVWDRPRCRFTDFVVQHRAAGASEWTTEPHGTLANTSTITGYGNGAPLEVRVATVNEEGMSGFTETVSLATLDLPEALFPATPWRAYGFRRLTGAATNAVRVRRSSDNAEADISFTADGQLDEDALRAFCGSGDGFVRTWLGQIGASLGVATAAYQPKIVSGGVVVKDGGRPGMLFDGVDDYLFTTSGGFTDGTGATFVIVCRWDVTGGEESPRILSERSSTAAAPMYTFYATEDGTGGSQFRNDASTIATVTSPDVWADGALQILAFTDTKAAARFLRGARVMDPAARAQSGTLTTDRFTLGALNGNGTVTNRAKVTICEAYFWREALTPEALTPLLDNIRAHYSL